MAKGTSSNDIVISIRTELDKRGIEKAKKAVQELQSTFKGLKHVGTKRLTEDLKAMEAPILKSQESFQKYIGALKHVQGALMGIGFAFLFTGMMVNRFAMQILKSTIKTFNKITTGSEESSGALGILNVHFELLKFAIGGAISALVEAWLPTIIEIVTYMVDWIEQHKELAAKIVVYTAIGTAIAMIVGAMALFSTGMVGLIEKFSLLSYWFLRGGTNAEKFSTALRGLAKIAGIGILIYTAMRILGRDYQTGWGEALIDALLAGAGGFLVAGPAGLVIGVSLVIFSNLASVLSDMSFLDFMLHSWGNLALFVEQSIERAVMGLKNLGRLAASLKPGGETPQEAWAKAEEEIGNLRQKFDDDWIERESDRLAKQAKFQMKTLAKELAKAGETAKHGLISQHPAFKDVNIGQMRKALDIKTSKEFVTILDKMIEEFNVGKDELSKYRETTTTLNDQTHKTTNSLNALDQKAQAATTAFQNFGNAVLGGGTSALGIKTSSAVQQAVRATDSAYIARKTAEGGTGAGLFAEKTRSLFRVTTASQLQQHIGQYGGTQGYTAPKPVTIYRGTTIQSQTNITDGSSATISSRYD